jgi:hypothetical protein
MPRWVMKTPEQRFWEKVGPHTDPDACWLWQGATITVHGLRYGRFGIGPANHHKTVLAHRFSYELLVGPIPEGLTLDHVKARGCTNTLCVNPGHLEPVTNKVNILRGVGMSALNSQKAACLRGHPFDAENTYIGVGVYGSRRQCRACGRIRDRARRQKARSDGSL